MKTFVINEREYVAKPFDFNTICDLEDMGVSLEEAQTKPMSMVRAYFAICTGRGKDYAGKELEAHIINGGAFEDVILAMSHEMENSDFFRNLNNGQSKAKRSSKSSK